MKKILIIGISGTGKSHLAHRLSEQTGIPTTHCDDIAWKSGWIAEDPAIVSRKLQKVLDKNTWIIEGYIAPLASERVNQADLIIYLDFPGYLALLGGITRWWMYRGKERPGVQPGNKEDLPLMNFWSMLTRKERSEIEAALKKCHKKTIRLTSWKAANNFVLPGVDNR